MKKKKSSKNDTIEWTDLLLVQCDFQRRLLQFTEVGVVDADKMCTVLAAIRVRTNEDA